MAPPSIGAPQARALPTRRASETASAREGSEAAGILPPARRQSARWAARLKKLGHLLGDCLYAVFHDDLDDRINEFPEYRKARMQALQYAMLRGINR